MKCSLYFCDKDHYAKGYCTKHYLNWRRFGTPIAPRNHDLQEALLFSKTMAMACQEGDVKRLSELSAYVLETAELIERGSK